jgi:hypothetical protein
MMNDLLVLYAKVGAREATGENLRIVYEFDPTDPLDQLLSEFREQTATARRLATRTATTFAFDLGHVWQAPVGGLRRRDLSELTGPGRAREWRFDQGLSTPAPTGDPDADAVISRWSALLDSVLGVLSSLGPTANDVSSWLEREGDNGGPLERAVAIASNDYWVMNSWADMQTFADTVRTEMAGPAGAPTLVDEVSSWLDGFVVSEDLQALADELSDLFSMPTWGKRHELYSAWIATQLDRALQPGRLAFKVVDGALRFPFKATKVADFTAAGGEFELWCELRSALAEPVSKKRKSGIQPDYRVVARGANPVEGTALAVEVKQYLRPASRAHAEAVTDYSAGLPTAKVFLVGHGPLGPTVLSRVPAADRARVRMFEQVRPDTGSGALTFRDEVALLFPRPRGLPARIELRWDTTVHDLDLYVEDDEGTGTSWQNLRCAHSALRKDDFDGGPEVVDVVQESDRTLEVSVRLYSDDCESVHAAHPEVRLIWSDGVAQRLRPADPPSESSVWHVCRLERLNGVLVSSESSADDIS